MSQFDQIAEELFKRGQIIRDSWFAAWVANIERMRQEFENSERFLSDYQHLLQPMSPPQPLHSQPPYDTSAGAAEPMASPPFASPSAGSHLPPLFGSGSAFPPPLPTDGSVEDDQAWFDRITARRENFPRG